MSAAFEQAILNKQAKIGVIGLGYVGLPLIHAFVKAGFTTLGFDVDQRKVDSLLAGKSYIKHLDSKLIQDWLARKKFEPTSDMKRLAEADAILICVPTPLREPRSRSVLCRRDLAIRFAKALRKGQLVVLESTTYPTTTRDVVLPILERAG
jgi:UDP-N-acetyl-D-glucosamine dehydrogenase